MLFALAKLKQYILELGGGVVQSGKCLPCKPKNTTHIKQIKPLGMMARACEVETSEFLGW